MRDDFCVFILSHGRPDRQYTLNTLRKEGYTGKIYIVIDNEDKTEAEYRKLYGEMIVQFDKLAVSKTFDTGDLEEDRRTIVYARNACFDLARQVGCKYFLELDDDYTYFSFKRLCNGNFHNILATQLDRAFEAMLNFLENSPCVTSICFAQGGDFIGGAQSESFKKAVKRKVMNSFFCSVDRPFQFLGRINEDVNTYTTLATRGVLFYTILGMSLNQQETQHNAGGMTDVYKARGTYLKSFYSVMFCPSAVKISTMGGAGNGVCYRRIHHNVKWNNCAPLVLPETCKKKEAE
jgi:hypothetical protein